MRRLLIIFIIIGFLVTACSTNKEAIVNNKEGTFLYSYSFNNVEAIHKGRVNQWINEEGTPIKTYEVNGDNNRYYYYVYSKDYNNAVIQHYDDTIEITVVNSKELDAGELLLKLKFNNEKINLFVLKEE